MANVKDEPMEIQVNATLDNKTIAIELIKTIMKEWDISMGDIK